MTDAQRKAADRLARKLAGLCAELGCASPALDDNERCRRHQAEHAWSNRGWKHRRKWRREQLVLPVVGCGA